MTWNLKKRKTRLIPVSFNKEADDYKDISESVQKANVYVVDCVKEAISNQTIQTLNENTIKEEALAKIQEFYKSKCIVQISLSGYMRRRRGRSTVTDQ